MEGVETALFLLQVRHSMLTFETQTFEVRENVCVRGWIDVAGQFSSEHFLVFLPSLFISDMSIPRECRGGYHSWRECPQPPRQRGSSPGRRGMAARGLHPLPTAAGSPDGLAAGVWWVFPENLCTQLSMVSDTWSKFKEAFTGTEKCVSPASVESVARTRLCLKAYNNSSRN